MFVFQYNRSSIDQNKLETKEFDIRLLCKLFSYLNKLMHDTLFIFELIPFFFILVECDDGFYNRLCTGVCGNCKNGAYCEKENGYCPNGCIYNFKYPFCKGTAVYTFYSIIFVPLTFSY